MLKAGSLFYAIAITLVISLVACSYVLASYLNRSFLRSHEERDRIIRNVDSGFNLLLTSSNSVKTGEIKRLDLFGTGRDFVTLQRKTWGAFEIISASASKDEFNHQKVATIGSRLFEERLTSLYLADNGKPLSIAGNTKLSGICYLPKDGVKRAYIEGKGYEGNDLVAGVVRKSTKHLPPINMEMIKNNLAYLNGDADQGDSILSIDDVVVTDTIHQSFTERTVLLYSENAMIIQSQSYIGNVILVSSHAITLAAEAQIEDVLIYAPEIIIESGFAGTLQAFASNTLKIEEGCELKYPTVLGVIASDDSKKLVALELGERSSVSGAVFGYGKQSGSKNNVQVKIGKEARVTGQVYCGGSLELRGVVHGGVVCNRFRLATRSSVYENHLLDAVIDPSGLSEFFVGINLFESSTETHNTSFDAGPKKVVKWLN